MSEEKKNLPAESEATASKAAKKEKSKAEKKPFFLVRWWKTGQHAALANLLPFPHTSLNYPLS